MAGQGGVGGSVSWHPRRDSSCFQMREEDTFAKESVKAVATGVRGAPREGGGSGLQRGSDGRRKNAARSSGKTAAQIPGTEAPGQRSATDQGQGQRLQRDENLTVG